MHEIHHVYMERDGDTGMKNAFILWMASLLLLPGATAHAETLFMNTTVLQWAWAERFVNDYTTYHGNGTPFPGDNTYPVGGYFDIGYTAQFRTYWTYDITGIPAGSNIRDAQFCYYASSSNYFETNTTPEGFWIQPITADWDASTIDFTFTGYNSSTIWNLTISGYSKYYCWNLTQLVKDRHAAGTKNASFILRSRELVSGNKDRRIFGPTPTATANIPYMNITYTAPPTTCWTYSAATRRLVIPAGCRFVTTGRFPI